MSLKYLYESDNNKNKHLTHGKLLGCYFKDFPLKISLLPKIVTEAHANLKKRKLAATLL